MKLRIGSRGSQLALWQANHIAALLRVQGHEVEIEIIKTTGDRLQEVTFAQVGSKGMFTKEIEEALADGPYRSGRAFSQRFAHRAAGAVCAGCDARASRSQRRLCFGELCKSCRAAARRESGNQQPAPPRAVEGASPRPRFGGVPRQCGYAPAQTGRRASRRDSARRGRPRSPGQDRLGPRAARSQGFLPGGRAGRFRNRSP